MKNDTIFNYVIWKDSRLSNNWELKVISHTLKSFHFIPHLSSPLLYSSLLRRTLPSLPFIFHSSPHLEWFSTHSPTNSLLLSSIQLSPILSYPLLSSPFLFSPILSSPFLSYPLLSYLILASPLLSSPILSSPRLSFTLPSLIITILTFPILISPYFIFNI